MNTLFRISTSACLALLTFTTVFAHSQKPAQAATDFSSKVHTTYTVHPDAVTTVSHEFTITNQTPTTYLKQYAIQTSSKQIEQISVTENTQTIEPNVAVTDTATSIGVTFPTDVVGQGKSRVFTIAYDTRGLATAGGRALEIHLPSLSNEEQFDERTVSIITPLLYGGAVRSTVKPTEMKIEDQTIRTVFSGLQSEGLSVFYGESQVYHLTLRYHLENASSSRGLAQIALPPDTSYQKLHFHELDPPPRTLKEDADGNWIATYELAPQTATTVHLTAEALLGLEPNNVPVRQPLPIYTAEQKFWETKQTKLAEQARSLQTPQAIYNYVVDTLTYAHSKANLLEVERLGAANALQYPDQAVCQEFTDVFIAMSRAAGIPARRLTGFAYTQDESTRPLSLVGDVLHAWPEYFDTEKNRWIQVDPTWEQTTGGVDYFTQFDLNHIVFAINGTSSTTPYPAGSYKSTDPTTKDVEVKFGNEFPEIQPDLEVSLRPRELLGIQVPGLYTLVISNRTGQAWYDMRITPEVGAGRISVGNNQPLPTTILPFQRVELPLQVVSSEWYGFAQTPLTVTTSLGETPYDTFETTTQAGPQFITVVFDPRFLPYLGTGLVVGTLATGSVLVFRRKR